jgi:hypothetical protein
MSHNLRMATIAVVLAFAAMGSANARTLNHNQLYPGYAGEVYPSAPAAHFVPGRGIVGESCDLPTSACSNDERISN